jgi:hypothetical protein
MLIMPRFMAIVAITSFQGEAGGYRPWIARSTSGCASDLNSALRTCGSPPLMNAFGS